MIARPWWRPRLNVAWKGFNRFASLMGSISDILSVLGTVAAFFGLTLSKADTTIPHLPIENAPFSVRLVIFVAFAAGVGWMTGILVRLSGRLSRDVRMIACILIAIVMAGFVAGLADWLVSPRQRTELPQEFLLAMIGAMCAIRCMVENLSAQRGGASPAAVSERSLVPLAFTIATATILVFHELGAR